MLTAGVIAAVLRVEDREGMEEALAGVARAVGHAFYVVALEDWRGLRQPQYVVLSNGPANWTKLLLEGGLQGTDPLHQAALRSPAPFSWHANDFREQSPTFWSQAMAHGVHSGLAASSHLPASRMTIGFVREDATGPERASDAQAFDVYRLLALATHARLLELITAHGSGAFTSRLSRRESECLRHAARGRTSDEIAARVGISEATVNFHLNNAARKMEAANRQHAVAIAASFGLLVPD